MALDLTNPAVRAAFRVHNAQVKAARAAHEENLARGGPNFRLVSATTYCKRGCGARTAKYSRVCRTCEEREKKETEK